MGWILSFVAFGSKLTLKRDLLSPQFPPDKRKTGLNEPFRSEPVGSPAPPRDRKEEAQVKSSRAAPRRSFKIKPCLQNKTVQFPHSNHCSCFTTDNYNKRRSRGCLVTTVLTNITFSKRGTHTSLKVVMLPPAAKCIRLVSL